MDLHNSWLCLEVHCNRDLGSHTASPEADNALSYATACLNDPTNPSGQIAVQLCCLWTKPSDSLKELCVALGKVWWVQGLVVQGTEGSQCSTNTIRYNISSLVSDLHVYLQDEWVLQSLRKRPNKCQSVIISSVNGKLLYYIGESDVSTYWTTNKCMHLLT